MLAAIGIYELAVIVLFGGLALAVTAFWIWMIVDAVRNPRLSDTERVVWVIIICLLQAIGALVYLLFGRGRSGPAGNPRPTS